jgi:hypothetical protein
MKYLIAGAAALAVLLLPSGTALAQKKGQGKFLTEATQRLIGQVATANADGFRLANNTFSIGGGWLRQGAGNWVNLYTIRMEAGMEYRILASGDNDAVDVDVQVVNAKGTTVASDTARAANASVTFRPKVSQDFQIRVRLFESRDSLPCVCVAIVLEK